MLHKFNDCSAFFIHITWLVPVEWLIGNVMSMFILSSPVTIKSFLEFFSTFKNLPSYWITKFNKFYNLTEIYAFSRFNAFFSHNNPIFRKCTVDGQSYNVNNSVLLRDEGRYKLGYLLKIYCRTKVCPDNFWF